MAKSAQLGLVTRTGQVPLRGVVVDAKVKRTVADVIVKQRYRNDEATPVEAVYSFPIPESAVLSRFEVVLGDRRLHGRVVERDDAFDQYDDALADGHLGVLLDQARPNVFAVSVGNLRTGEELIIEFAYVIELAQTADSLRLVVPTTIAPRYVPIEQARSAEPAELDHILPPIALAGVPYGLRLSVDLEVGSEIRELTCPSHPVRMQLQGSAARIELLGDAVQLDHDFVLDVTLARPHESTVLTAADDAAAAVMIQFRPDWRSTRRVPREVIMLIDRSGSMDGTSIAQARNALQLCLRSLEAGDWFNVIGFGSTVQPLFAASRPFTQESLDAATAWVETMQADLGGTELYGPLQASLAAVPQGELPRRVLVITDGQVSNERECLGLVQQLPPWTRVFTLGIGSAVSDYLVNSLARGGRGAAEFIHPGERLEPKIVRQFGRLKNDDWNDVRVDWGAIRPELVAPAELGPLFLGDHLTVLARIPAGASGEVALLADGPEGTLRAPVHVSSGQLDTCRAIPVLLARRAIQECEERATTPRGSVQNTRKQEQVARQVRTLALRYQIMSSETSFLAIEERSDGTEQQVAVLRRVPVALAPDWRVAHDFCFPDTAAYSRDRDLELDFDCSADSVDFFIASPDGRARKRSSAFASAPAASWLAGDPTSSSQDDVAFQSMMTIVSKQAADGSFPLSKELSSAVGSPQRKIAAAAAELPAPRELAKQCLATLLTLKVLEQRYSQQRDSWRLVADKATAWLDSLGLAPPPPHASLQAWTEHLWQTWLGEVKEP